MLTIQPILNLNCPSNKLFAMFQRKVVTKTEVLRRMGARHRSCLGGKSWLHSMRLTQKAGVTVVVEMVVVEETVAVATVVVAKVVVATVVVVEMVAVVMVVVATAAVVMVVEEKVAVVKEEAVKAAVVMAAAAKAAVLVATVDEAPAGTVDWVVAEKVVAATVVVVKAEVVKVVAVKVVVGLVAAVKEAVTVEAAEAGSAVATKDPEHSTDKILVTMFAAECLCHMLWQLSCSWLLFGDTNCFHL